MGRVGTEPFHPVGLQHIEWLLQRAGGGTGLGRKVVLRCPHLPHADGAVLASGANMQAGSVVVRQGGA